MKRGFLLCMMSVALIATSCLKGSFYSDTTEYCFFDDANALMMIEKDSVYFKSEFMGGNSIAFFNKSAAEDLDGGFLISKKCDTTYVTGHKKSLYSVADTTGAEKSIGFLVFKQNEDEAKMPEKHILFINSKFGTATPVGSYVCNTNYLANLMMFGADGFEKFGQDDWLKVVATPIVSGKPVSANVIEIYLAKDGKIVTDWKFWDMSKLGNFENINFSVESSRTDIPKYFCIDNLLFRVVVSG